MSKLLNTINPVIKSKYFLPGVIGAAVLIYFGFGSGFGGVGKNPGAGLGGGTGGETGGDDAGISGGDFVTGRDSGLNINVRHRPSTEGSFLVDTLAGELPFGAKVQFKGIVNADRPTEPKYFKVFIPDEQIKELGLETGSHLLDDSENTYYIRTDVGKRTN